MTFGLRKCGKLRHNTHDLGQSENLIFCVSLATCTCIIWRNILSHIWHHFKHSVCSFIHYFNYALFVYLMAECCCRHPWREPEGYPGSVLFPVTSQAAAEVRRPPAEDTADAEAGAAPPGDRGDNCWYSTRQGRQPGRQPVKVCRMGWMENQSIAGGARELWPLN